MQALAIWSLPVIFAITLHEAAHGYVARHFGDLTAYAAGRITLNPLKHIDPVGTLLVPGLILAVSSMGGNPMLFGWAKPVPVDFSRLRHPKRDMLWVAAAGPASNLVMALAWAIMFKLVIGADEHSLSVAMVSMAAAGVSINLVLMVLNLLPLPPLDGGRIAVSLLPRQLAYRFAQIEPYGFPILLLLLFTGVLSAILLPLLNLAQLLVETLVQISIFSPSV